jgi:hypothetical protein
VLVAGCHSGSAGPLISPPLKSHSPVPEDIYIRSMSVHPQLRGEGVGVQHPWITALLLGTVVTPAGIIFAWLAPRPLDAIGALPLVLLDVLVAPGAGAVAGPFTRFLLLLLGIALTWLLYVLVARLVIWRLSGP